MSYIYCWFAVPLHLSYAMFVNRHSDPANGPGTVGDFVGLAVVGDFVGVAVVGDNVGNGVGGGGLVGDTVGKNVITGGSVIVTVGDNVGLFVGDTVGLFVRTTGDAVGFFVGNGVSSGISQILRASNSQLFISLHDDVLSSTHVKLSQSQRGNLPGK